MRRPTLKASDFLNTNQHSARPRMGMSDNYVGKNPQVTHAPAHGGTLRTQTVTRV